MFILYTLSVPYYIQNSLCTTSKIKKNSKSLRIYCIILTNFLCRCMLSFVQFISNSLNLQYPFAFSYFAVYALPWLYSTFIFGLPKLTRWPPGWEEYLFTFSQDCSLWGDRTMTWTNTGKCTSIYCVV